MAKRVWQCDTCHGVSDTRPWNCPGCSKETCDSCFHTYAHCKTCTTKAWVELANKQNAVSEAEIHAAAKQAEEELRLAANKAGYDFEEPNETTVSTNS